VTAALVAVFTTESRSPWTWVAVAAGRTAVVASKTASIAYRAQVTRTRCQALFI
jgi:hypothetical protein